ncbi:hypothetical protein EJD97_016896 [Solanum chilense]|uniref:Uncharacterized protein n=1 Tax=Solanum chilense TaxID=4083 RepID=A0A6N2B6G6_SOLCI|nr:hypothetical protein EJD97_016896 [Solanum chilense]
MEEFASMRKKMVALRKKNKAFHSNMIDKLQKMLEKYPIYEQEANNGPHNPYPEAAGEEDDEEIVYKPPFLGRTLNVICVDQKLADHPYFTRSKGPADFFPRQSSDKGKTVMGDSNEEVSLTDVVVAQPTLADQIGLILQLMQQIAEIRVEMQRRQDLTPPGFAANAVDGRPPIYFPSSNMDPAHNQPSTPARIRRL